MLFELGGGFGEIIKSNIKLIKLALILDLYKGFHDKHR